VTRNYRNIAFDILNRLSMDHKCDGRTDGQTEWPLSIARSNTVRRVLKRLQTFSEISDGTRFATSLTPVLGKRINVSAMTERHGTKSTIPPAINCLHLSIATATGTDTDRSSSTMA